MQNHDLVGSVLILGLIVFLVGAAAWRLEYERPLDEALPLIHGDRRRRAWIHLWMIPAMFITSAGIFGLGAVIDDGLAVTLVPMGATVYALGALCWIISLAFRLTVVPWAAEHTVEGGDPPPSFVALDSWSGSLYAIHMLSAYASFAILGAAILADGDLSPWLGWLGIGWGSSFIAGFVATRLEGPFNPPAWAHLYTGLIGVMLLIR